MSGQRDTVGGPETGGTERAIGTSSIGAETCKMGKRKCNDLGEEKAKGVQVTTQGIPLAHVSRERGEKCGSWS